MKLSNKYKKRSNMLIWQKKNIVRSKKKRKNANATLLKELQLTIRQWNILKNWYLLWKYFSCLTFFLTFCDLAPLDPPEPVVGVRRYIRLNKSVVWGMEVSINSAKATVAGLSVFCFLKIKFKKKKNKEKKTFPLIFFTLVRG